MRIALVAEDYYPQLGGVPEHVHNLALQFTARGHHVTVVASRMRGRHIDAAFVRRVGTSVVIYANGGISRVTVGWRLGARLEALFREGRYDVVHVHGGLAPTFGVVAPRAAWRLGIPVVATFHSWFPRSVGCRVFRRPLQRALHGPGDRRAARLLRLVRPVSLSHDARVLRRHAARSDGLRYAPGGLRHHGVPRGDRGGPRGGARTPGRPGRVGRGGARADRRPRAAGRDGGGRARQGGAVRLAAGGRRSLRRVPARGPVSVLLAAGARAPGAGV